MLCSDGWNKAAFPNKDGETEAVDCGAKRKARPPLMRLGCGLALAFLLAAWARTAPAVLITEYTANANNSPVTAGITLGPDGRFWFAEYSLSFNAIGRISTNATTSVTTVTNFHLPTPVSHPYGITAGPDGNIWFTELQNNKIGRMSTNGVLIGEYTVPTTNSSPYGIITGPDNNIWFIERDASKITAITNLSLLVTNQVASNAFMEIPTTTTNAAPCLLTVGADGNIWFTETGVSQIARLNMGTMTLSEFSLPSALPGQATNAQPFGIAAGPTNDGAIWFTEYTRFRIGRMDLTGSNVVEYLLPTGGQPYGITLGLDGALWFTDWTADQIGRVTPNGTNTNTVIVEYPIPSGAVSPAFLASAPDRSIWFTEFSGYNIGKVSDSPLTLSTANFTFAAGTLFSNIVGTILDPDPTNTPASAYTAVINWGDGTISNGVITTNHNGHNFFDVTGTHTYTTAALYNVTLTATDNDTSHDMGGATTTVTNKYTVTSPNGRPALKLLQQGTNVVVTWPGSEPSFTLQVTTNLVNGSNNWLKVNSTPVLAPSSNYPGQFLYQVTNFINRPEVFYRLKSS